MTASEPVRIVFSLGVEGGGVYIGVGPEGDHWYCVSVMPISFWLDDEEDASPAADCLEPGDPWTRGLSWDDVVEQLEAVQWWKFSPIEIAPDYADRVAHALDRHRLSHGFQWWLRERG